MKAAFKSSPFAIRAFLFYAWVAGALMLVMGVSAGVAWHMDARFLLGFGGASMRLMAALGFVFTGIALLARRGMRRRGWLKWVSLAASAVVFALGVDALVAHHAHSPVGLSAWLDTHWGQGQHRPTLMATLAAVGFIGLALQGALIVQRRFLVLRELCGLVVLAIGMASLASMAFTWVRSGDTLFDELPSLTGMGLLIGTLGWMSSSPSTGLTKIATSASMGGLFARSLLLPSLLLPALYMFVFKTLETRFGVSEVLASTLGSLFTGGTVAIMVWVMATLLDRSQRQTEVSRYLREKAETDPLTGLGNRRRFDAVMAELFDRYHAKNEPFVLLMLDIDHFKSYNDTYGHQAGDEALQGVSRVLCETIRPQDHAVRYGGEEFAVMLDRVQMQQASVVAGRLMQAVQHWDGPHRHLSVSIGGAEVSLQDTLETLIQRADAALYQAKRNGRNCFIGQQDDAPGLVVASE